MRAAESTARWYCGYFFGVHGRPRGRLLASRRAAIESMRRPRPIVGEDRESLADSSQRRTRVQHPRRTLRSCIEERARCGTHDPPRCRLRHDRVVVAARKARRSRSHREVRRAKRRALHAGSRLAPLVARRNSLDCARGQSNAHALSLAKGRTERAKTLFERHHVDRTESIARGTAVEKMTAGFGVIGAERLQRFEIGFAKAR